MNAREEETARPGVRTGTRAGPADPGRRPGCRTSGPLRAAAVPPERLVEETPAEAPDDPLFGRDPDTEWMIRCTTLTFRRRHHPAAGQALRVVSSARRSCPRRG